MKFKLYIYAAVLLVSTSKAYAQQDPMFTHYMYNTLAVNPGYAGSRDAFTATLLHRSQWVGFTGAPVTQTLTLHTPVAGNKVGLGLSILNDKIGPLKTTSAYVDFAYRIPVTQKSTLALGLKGGFNWIDGDLSGLALDNPADASFANNSVKNTLPNFGFGAYYSRQRFYAGISTPKLLDNEYSDVKTAGAESIAKEQKHFFIIAGGLIHLSKEVDFKPTGLFKMTESAPVQLDGTATFILKEKLLLGAMYRTGDAAGLLIGFNFTEQLHAGYSFDWSFTNSTSKYNDGSHEIMLSYDLIFNDKDRIRSPRFF